MGAWLGPTATHAAIPATALREEPRALRRLTLAEALELAHVEDAPLAEADEQLAEATVEATRTYPFNPFVQFQVLPYASAGTPAVAHYVLMMQMIELGRQHRWRKAAGRASADQLRAARDQSGLAEAVAVARLYFAALYQRGLHELLLRRIDLEEARLAASHSAGQRSAEEQVLELVAGRSLRHEVDLAVLARDDAQALLAARLRLPVGTRLDLVGDLVTWRWPRVETTPGASPVDHPDLAATDASAAAAHASWNLARAARVPGLLIGPYYQRAPNGDVSVGFRGQVELPVLNAGRRLERMRAAELARRDLAAARARADLERRAAQAVTRYGHVAGLAAAFQADLTAALDATGDSLALRDARLRADRIQLDMLFQVAQAAVDVGGSTGLLANVLLDHACIGKPEHCAGDGAAADRPSILVGPRAPR